MLKSQEFPTAGEDHPNPKVDVTHGGLLEQANRLRKEAAELEIALSQERQRLIVPLQPSLFELPSYADVKDSVWTFNYRFSDQPEPKKVEESEVKRSLYAGRLCLKFRADGYTDILSHEPRSNSSTTNLEVVKAWGWDLERSNEDGQEYLSFSVDAKVNGNNPSRRFYFQIRHIREQGFVMLQDGTVTVKQDVFDDSIASRWSLFSPKGILAQFRYVGNFAVTKTLSSLLK